MPASFPPPPSAGQRPASSGHCRPDIGQGQRVGDRGSVEYRSDTGQIEAPSGENLTPTSPHWVHESLPEVVAALKALPLEDRARIAAELLPKH